MKIVHILKLLEPKIREIVRDEMQKVDSNKLEQGIKAFKVLNSMFGSDKDKNKTKVD